MATIVNYTPQSLIAKALFNFDQTASISNFKLSGTVRVSISDSFVYANYVYSNVYNIPISSNIYTSLPSGSGMWTLSQLSNIQTILDSYSSFANISFSSVANYSGNTPANVGNNSDINISLIYRSDLTMSGQSAITRGYGYAGSPLDIVLNWDGFGPYGLYNDMSLSTVSFGGHVLMHEIGHSLGLSHPHGNYSSVGATLTGDYRLTVGLGFEKLGFVIAQASDMNKEYFSIMSYDDQMPMSEANTYAQTPMILDVIALQEAYGVGRGTSGNGDDEINPGGSGGVNSYRTYFDPAGVDKINLTNYSGGAYLNMGTTIVGATHLVGVSMSIADYQLMSRGSSPSSLRWLYGEFENALGSANTDLIVGNLGNNSIDGGSGDDLLNGSGGDDIIIGGDGLDIAFYTGLFSNYDIRYVSTTKTYTLRDKVANRDGTDTLLNVEKISFGGATPIDISSLLSRVNQAPVITSIANGRVFTTNGWVQMTPYELSAERLVITDGDGDAIQRYRITTDGSDRNVEVFANGVLIAAGASFEFTSADVAAGRIYYRGLTRGTDTLQLQVFDGQDWSAARNFDVVSRPANQAPQVTARSAKATLEDRGTGGTLLTTLLNYFDPDSAAYGDTVQGLQLFSTGANGGYFTVNGIRQAVGAVITVNAADMGNVRYYAGTVGTSETLYAKAYDGSVWSDNWVSWSQSSGRANNQAPVVSMVTDKRVFVPNGWVQLDGSQLSASNLMVSDSDGDVITRYRVTTDSSDVNVQWYANGAVVVAGTSFEFSAADVTAGRVYYRGVTQGRDTLQIQAFDGQDWGVARNFDVVSRPANQAPQVTARSAKATLEDRGTGGTLLTTLLNYFDPDSAAYGDTVQGLQLFSTGANGGYFTVNGIRQAVGAVITVNAADMGNVRYYAGTVGTSETLYAKAYDGSVWSDNWVSWSQSSGRANNQAPVVSMVTDKRVFVPNGWVQLDGSQLSASNLMVSDSDGDVITRYRVTTDSSDVNVQWYANGAVVVAGTSFEFSAADVTAGRVYYRGVTQGRDTLQIQAFDGQDWGVARNFDVVSRPANQAPQVTARSAKATLEDRGTGGTLLTTLLNYFDPDSAAYGDTVQGLQLFSTGANGGYFTVNGIRQAVGAVITVNAADMGNVRYYAGTVGTSETLYAKAYDGSVWSDNWVSWSQSSGRANNQAPVVSMVTDKRVFVPNGWVQLDGLTALCKQSDGER
jgi:hypothetical protein